MRYSEIGILVLVACSIAAQAQSESSNRCAGLEERNAYRSRDHEFRAGSGGENHCACLSGGIGRRTSPRALPR